MSPKYRNFDRFDILPASWTDAFQEFVATYMSPNFALVPVTTTAIRCVAGPGNDQVAIGINGLFRYVTANVDAGHPGGAAAVYDVWATTGPNSFSNSPQPDTDNTDYSFALVIRAAGSPPTAFATRKVGTVTWNGTSISKAEVIGKPTAETSIPGEVKLWPGSVLPNPDLYGKWVWTDGTSYVTATYPVAAANISTAWRTAHGQADPGAGNFRVPDLRGLSPVGLDAMPGGTRANRTTRSVAITLAARSGEEYHTISVAEMPSHGHGATLGDHAHGVYDIGHRHETWMANGGDNEAPPAPNSFAVTPIAGTQSRTIGPTPVTAFKGFGMDHVMPYSQGTGIGIYGAGALGVSVANNGSGGTHENIPPSVYVPYIVRLDG